MNVGRELPLVFQNDLLSQCVGKLLVIGSYLALDLI